MRPRIGLAVSVGLGIVAALLMFVHMSSAESDLLQLAELKEVIVARLDILPNTVLDERLLETVRVPAKYVQPAATADGGRLIGRIVAVPVPKGTQVLGTFLQGGERSISYDVPRGRRALTLRANEVSAVGGLIEAGNFVDILGTFEFGRPIGYKAGQIEYADERTETRVMLQNVPVVAVNRQMRRPRVPPRPAEQSIAAAAGSPLEPLPAAEVQTLDTVTVIVDPKDAQRLVLAQQIGTLTLMLRSTLDTGQLAETPLLDPLGLLGVSIPVKPKSAPFFREMRGAF